MPGPPALGELVLCSRCPYAMYATLVAHDDGTFSVVFHCERCDRAGDA